MRDPLMEKLQRIKTYSSSAKRRASLYSDVAKIDDKKTAQSLGALTKAPAPGKKLQTIGFILFWIPEPTMVTSAIGGPMILAGKYLEKKYNSATIADIGDQTRETTTSIHNIKSSLL